MSPRPSVLLFMMPLTLALLPGMKTQGPSPSSTQQPTPLSPSGLFAKLSNSVFVVEVLDEKEIVIAQGSGVATGRSEVVTNKHVVVGGESLRLRQGQKAWPAVVSHLDPNADLCLLAVDGLDAAPVTIRPLKGISIGERVYAIGAPEGLELTLSEGLVSGIRAETGVPVVQTTTPISPGSSGGGLFDSQGELIGITAFFLKGGQALNFAIPGELVELLASQSLQQTMQAWLALGDDLMAKSETEAPGNEPTTAPHEDPKAWTQWARARMELIRPLWKGASIAYREALRIDPNSSVTWVKLGNVYAKLGEREKMINAFQQALRLEPNKAAYWRSYAEGYNSLEDPEQAVAHYQEALKLFPGDASLWSGIGSTYWSLQKEKEAQKCLEDAVRLAPTEASYLYQLGLYYVLRGKRSCARDIYRRLKTLNPVMAESLKGMI